MGFLHVNKRRKKDSLAVRKRAPESSKTPSPVPSPRSTPDPAEPADPGMGLSALELLPREILEQVLVYSSNLNLCYASRTLLTKLSPTLSLEASLVKHHVDAKTGALNTVAVLWPFVTRSLLVKLGIRQFTSEHEQTYVPYVLESHLTSANVSLMAYMVEQGCFVEDSYKMYIVFIEHGHWSAVEAMAVSNEQPCDVDAPILALQANQSAELVIMLLRVTRGIDSDKTALYRIQQIAVNTGSAEVCAYIGSH